jgi:hypothetical protein
MKLTAHGSAICWVIIGLRVRKDFGRVTQLRTHFERDLYEQIEE